MKGHGHCDILMVSSPISSVGLSKPRFVMGQRKAIKLSVMTGNTKTLVIIQLSSLSHRHANSLAAAMIRKNQPHLRLNDRHVDSVR